MLFEKGTFRNKSSKNIKNVNLITKKIQGTSPMCLIYHPSGQTIIQDSNKIQINSKMSMMGESLLKFIQGRKERPK